MASLTAVIESKELQIECRPCGWRDYRSLSWLSDHRDMVCPVCLGVIVLNTSDRRREMAALRRQAYTLHDQLTISIPATIRPLPAKPRLALTLLRQYRDNKWPSLNDSRTPRRMATARR
jgi:hypothetical protein